MNIIQKKKTKYDNLLNEKTAQQNYNQILYDKQKTFKKKTEKSILTAEEEKKLEKELEEIVDKALDTLLNAR